MSLIERTGNILDVAGKAYVAHCISGDFTLGAGLAKALNEKFDLSKQLYFHYDEPVSYVGHALLINKVFNLVVKQHYRAKASLDDLYDALENMKEVCREHGITEVYMPRIGCGREHLDWEEVKDILYDIFDESDVNVYVLTLPSQEDNKDEEDEENDEGEECQWCGEECDCDDGCKCHCNDEKQDMTGDACGCFIDDDDIEEDEEEFEPLINDERRRQLYDGMLAFLSKIFDEDDLYEKLLEIGFTPEEIEYEGFDPDADNPVEEDEFDCDGDCDCGEERECKCHGDCNLRKNKDFI